MSLTKQFLKSKPFCKVTFSLPTEAASDAEEVRVVGDFNQWNWKKGVAMKKKDGKYFAVVELPKDQSFEFRYLMDNQKWENDWNADGYASSPFGVDNSVVTT
jgi:1,4-alpha-glucan branching enzyme